MSNMRLGVLARDVVTNLEGIVTSRVEFLNGCVRVTIQAPKKENGDIPAAEWVDIEQVEVIGDGVSDQVMPRRTGGSDIPDPRKRF